MPSTALHTVPQAIRAQLDATPDRVLLDDDRHSVTGAELAGLIDRLAGGLLAQGLGADDVVAIIPTTSIEAVAVRYAAGLVGCATAFCPAGSPTKAAAFAREIGATAIVVLPETASAARLLRSELPVLSVAALLQHPAVPAPPVVNPDALGWLVSSGGTTGHPKASRRSFAEWLHSVSGSPAGPERRQLVCTSLVHVGQVLLDQTLIGGGTVVLRDMPTDGSIDAGVVLETIESERVTHVCLVEPQLAELVDHHALVWRDLRSLVAITHIGADAAPSLRLRLLRRLESVGLRHVLAHTYGASELGLISMLSGSDYGSDRPSLLGTAGRALPGVTVTIERPDGTSAVAGEDGRIVVSTAGAARGVVTSGDIGHLDDAGHLRVRGRATDARGVVPVFPVDVQDALCAHPHVRYAVALPTREGFDAVVVPMPGHCVTPRDLLDFVAREYDGPLPIEDIVVDRHLSLTEQGKPDRAALGALFTTQVQVA